MPNNSSVTSKQMLALYFAMMTIGMGQTVVFAVLPMLGKELELHLLVIHLPVFGAFAPKELAITALTSVASFTFFVAAPYWGRRSDAMGRKPVILIGLLGYTVGTIIFSAAAEAGLAGLVGGFALFAALMVTRVMLVSVMAAALPASSAYVIDVTRVESRAKGMGRLAAASQIGTMLGPPLALAVAISFLAPLYLQAGLTLLAAVLVWRLLPDSGLERSARRKQARLRYLDPRYRQYLGMGLVIYTAMGMVQQTLGFYFQDTLGLSAKEAVRLFALSMMVSSAAMLFAQLVVVQRWRVHPLHLLKTGLPFVVAGYLVLANAQSIASLLAGMGLFGLGMGLSTPGYNVTATLTVKAEEQGALAGLAASAPGMGFVIGPLLGGAIYSYEPSYTYWSAGLVLVPLMIYAWRMQPPVAPRL